MSSQAPLKAADAKKRARQAAVAPYASPSAGVPKAELQSSSARMPEMHRLLFPGPVWPTDALCGPFQCVFLDCPSFDQPQFYRIQDKKKLVQDQDVHAALLPSRAQFDQYHLPSADDLKECSEEAHHLCGVVRQSGTPSPFSVRLHLLKEDKTLLEIFWHKDRVYEKVIEEESVPSDWLCAADWNEAKQTGRLILASSHILTFQLAQESAQATLIAMNVLKKGCWYTCISNQEKTAFVGGLQTVIQIVF